MWWKVALQIAVQLGLDTWAKRKAGELIEKVKAKADEKIKHLEGVQAQVDAKLADLVPLSSGGTAVFRSTDGNNYVVRVDRKV